MAVLDVLWEILSTPALLVGILALIGLLASRAALPDVITGHAQDDHRLSHPG